MKNLITLIFVALLSACASQAQFGNFTKSNGQQREFSTVLATESVAQLHSSYAPASTTFSLIHPAKDEYGQQLIQQLRDKGFAVAEFGTGSTGQPLSYVVDYVGDNAILVTLRVGQSVTARMFDTKNNRLTATGNWSRLE